MGKRYWSELENLEKTFDWARTVDLGSLQGLREAYAECPLLAVGSGGSFSSAFLATYLHRNATGSLASAVTPLEIVHSPFDLRRIAVLFLTAGGGNPDVLGAFKKTAKKEPSRLGILCMKKNSPLAKLSKEYSTIDRFEFRLPAGKDGFLATNSLLATSVLLARAYEQPHVEPELPEALTDIAYQGQKSQDYLDWLEEESTALWDRETLVVLYGPSTHAAAVDLESKFAEAALGQIQLADFRNFAHGRHHWLAKHGATSAVLSFVTNDVRDVAQKTLALIPGSVPRLEIDLGEPGPRAAIGGIVNTLQLVGLIGKFQDFDPGRPHVPDFGRQIYHLKAFPTSRQRKAVASSNETVAIDRKSQWESPKSRSNGQLTKWEGAYKTFIKKLGDQRFGAIVCDYDGTLCDQTERFTEPRGEVVQYLRSLLKSGILLGVVSGRGTSLKTTLRGVLPQEDWDHVFLGYYNGAEIGKLSDDDGPDNRPRAGRHLTSTARGLESDESLLEVSTVDVRNKQISIVPSQRRNLSFCWERVQFALSRQTSRGIRVFRSGHSIDVVAPAVSKTNLVQHVRNQLPDEDVEILCIGDKGRWPGNDYELLMEPFSLSVDEVSSATESCWNLAPAGVRHVDAVLEYFGKCEVHKSFFQFLVSKEMPQ